MNWIIYFTKYGNCKKVAELVMKSQEDAGGTTCKMESGEVTTPKDVLADAPSLVFVGFPIRRDNLPRNARKWLVGFNDAIKAREEDVKKLRKKDEKVKDQKLDLAAVKAWSGRILIFFTHRFAEDSFKIEVNIKKFFKKLQCKDVVDGRFLDVLVAKVTGPVEEKAEAKVQAYIKSIPKPG
jgi:hypothetical protein